MKLRVSVTIGILSTVGLSTSAWADTFVNPLDTVPKPNVVIGFDHSVTMGIQRDCSNCHAPGNPNTRLNVAKQDILQTLPLFRDYFNFGGFTYKGCNYAEITSRYMPTPANPDASYNQVVNMISSVTHCGSRENGLPNSAAAWTNCITPTTGCAGDWPVIQTILGGSPPGIAFTTPTVTATVCNNPISPVPTYNIQASLISKLAGGGYSWPRWDPTSLTGVEVDADLCQPLENVLLQVQNELSQCSLDPTALWDMSFLATDWCQEGTIANTACTSWPFNNTCVCDQGVTGPTGETCFNAGVVASDCGIPYTFKARQQVAVCELYSVQPGAFGDFYQNQPDNHVNGALPGFCRENVGMIFTDGYMGDTSGVAAEAAAAIPTYLSVSGLSNLFVFRVADNVAPLVPFINAADAMQDELAGPTGLTTALLATDPATMQASFAQVLSRVFKGVYTGSSLTLDEYGTRAYVNSFTVPGYSATGPVTDTYIGWPQRLSSYPVDPITGAVGAAPTWESDWTSKVTASSCGPTSLGTPDVSVLGPGGNFRNGIGRNVTINSAIDRNGDGTPDPIPAGAGGGYTWGRSFGFGATEPVVVDAPREALGGSQSTTFAAHQLAVRTRKRAVYVQSGGYVLGYDGGDYDATPITYSSGGLSQKLAFQYRETGSTGAEILRFTPNWLNDPNADYLYGLNDLVQQPILSGDLEAREVYDGTQWRTVLAGSAGPNGRGFFTLDITNPCSASVIGQWTLPNAVDRASNEPRIYTVPTTSGPRPALIVTGGLNGSSTLYAYRLDGTNHYAGFNLQGSGTASYAVTPVCVDARGEGYVTHCYALRSDGHLSRVAVTQAGFGSEVDITPTGGSVNPIGGGRTFYTMPVAFFSADGNVNLVFGSGDFENLTVASVQNYVFKVTDEAVRKKALPNTAADITTTCYPAGGTGPTEGVFALAAGERMISSPVVVAGGVFWTAYTSTSNGCIAGTGALYGMNFESCYDVFTPGPNRPTAIPQGPGIPLTPTIHRRSNEVISQSTASPTPADMGSDTAKLRGGQRPVVKRLYWRPFMDLR